MTPKDAWDPRGRLFAVRDTASGQALRGSRGFTLIELVASMAVLAVLMMAVGSTVVLASKAVPSPNAPATHIIAASRILEQIAAELETAIEIDDLDVDELEFTVPDRDGDGVDEEIAYRWSGKPGDPLIRTYNDGPDQIVIPAVDRFVIGFTTREVTVPSDAPPIEASEVVAFSQDLFSAGLGGKVSIGTGVRVAEGFVPSVGGASHWRPTRAAFHLFTTNPKTGILRAVLRTADEHGKPSATELASVQINESAVTSNAWYFVNFNVAEPVAAGTKFFITLEFVSNSVAAEASIGSLSAFGQYRATGANPWATNNSALYTYVWGRPLVEDPNSPPRQVDVVDRVTLTLDTGGSARTSVRTSVSLLNMPEAP